MTAYFKGNEVTVVPLKVEDFLALQAPSVQTPTGVKYICKIILSPAMLNPKAFGKRWMLLFFWTVSRFISESEVESCSAMTSMSQLASLCKPMQRYV